MKTREEKDKNPETEESSGTESESTDTTDDESTSSGDTESTNDSESTPPQYNCQKNIPLIDNPKQLLHSNELINKFIEFSKGI